MGDSERLNDQVGRGDRRREERASVLLTCMVQKDACNIKRALPLEDQEHPISSPSRQQRAVGGRR